DLVLLRTDADGTATIVAATVLFSFGGVREKIGTPLASIHAPVPHYAESLERPGYARGNWELRRDGDLTLRRLPESAHVLFTVRTFCDPLPEIARAPEAARALLARLKTAPVELLRYKGLSDEGELKKICAYVELLGAGGGASGVGSSELGQAAG
ncbi:hypothetical protein T492DRAFT_866950, partial [Pavlovales sp. CCMP2436]